MRLSKIFEEKPESWGFRGDPYFWDHLKGLAENMLNVVLFGKTAKQWRDEHPEQKRTQTRIRIDVNRRRLMKDRNYRRYYVFTLLLVALLSAYPIYMGIRVLVKMMQDGLIPKDEYPKYIIPYTPIAVALIAGVLLIPVLQALFKKMDFMFGVIISIGIFFVCEHVMETKVLVQTTKISLASWQMSLCYVPPEGYQTRTWEAVDVLLGGYNPAFKSK